MLASAPTPRTLMLTAAAMLAFAGNSLLCRLALKTGAIDPASFTALRLAAGAAMLFVILLARGTRPDLRRHGRLFPAAMLFVYAAGFSYAYVTLDAASGALLLFGFVQATMIIAALLRGERASGQVWLGWLLAALGLLWMLLPGAGAPPLAGAALMASAGVAWGLYSLSGATAAAALPATAANFLLALTLLPLLLLVLPEVHVTRAGILYAVLSGAVTSGLGYVLWYAALPRLASLQAALVQLSVPPLTALGGLLLLGEAIGWRVGAAGCLVLGGIALSLAARRR